MRLESITPATTGEEEQQQQRRQWQPAAVVMLQLSCRTSSIYLMVSVYGLLCQRSHKVEGHVHEPLDLALYTVQKLGAMRQARTRVSTEVKVEAWLGHGEPKSDKRASLHPKRRAHLCLHASPTPSGLHHPGFQASQHNTRFFQAGCTTCCRRTSTPDLPSEPLPIHHHPSLKPQPLSTRRIPNSQAPHPAPPSPKMTNKNGKAPSAAPSSGTPMPSCAKKLRSRRRFRASTGL